MASQTPSDADEAETDSKRDAMAIVREIARSAANDDDSLLEPSHEDRDDLMGYTVDHSITPVTAYAKRGVTHEEATFGRYVWERIHVRIARDSIATSRIIDIAESHDWRVTDIWQNGKDTKAELGQHDLPAIHFSIEPRE